MLYFALIAAAFVTLLLLVRYLPESIPPRWRPQYVALVIGCGALAILARTSRHYGGRAVEITALAAHFLLSIIAVVPFMGNVPIAAIYLASALTIVAMVAHRLIALSYQLLFLLSCSLLFRPLLLWGESMPGPERSDLLLLGLVGLSAMGVTGLWKRDSEAAARYGSYVAFEEASNDALTRVNRVLQQRVIEERALAIAEERRRISAEVHDLVGYNLANIGMLAQAIVFEREGDRSVARAERIVEQSDRAITETRAALKQLSSMPVSQDSFELLLRHVAADFKHTPLTVVVEPVGPGKRVVGNRATECVRVVQEAIANSIRHAHATRIEIICGGDSAYLSVAVTDNGTEPDNRRRRGGRGLDNARDRIAALGGSLVFEHLPVGHVLRFRVPVEGEK